MPSAMANASGSIVVNGLTATPMGPAIASRTISFDVTADSSVTRMMFSEDESGPEPDDSGPRPPRPSLKVVK